MTELLTRNEQFIKPEIVNRAYLRAAEYVLVHTHNGKTDFPGFEEVYEEYITLIVEHRTNLSISEIDRELKQLKDLEMIDVEMGFAPGDFGIQKAAELLNYLMMSGFTFWYEGSIYNSPLQEVW